jgi:RNA polymerase sigma-70 factor (ECF subfamily)
LIELAKQGNEEAFDELIKKVTEKVRPTLFTAYSPLSTNDFEDAHQAAMVKAWGKIKSFRGDATFTTWFFSILRNELLNLFKERNLIRKHELSFEDMRVIVTDNGEKSSFETALNPNYPELSITDTARTLMEKQDELQIIRDMLNDVLDKMSPCHGKIMRMVFEEGKSYKEVSDELNLSIGTVMSRIHYARKHAQKLIKQYAKRNDLQFTFVGQPK